MNFINKSEFVIATMLTVLQKDRIINICGRNLLVYALGYNVVTSNKLEVKKPYKTMDCALLFGSEKCII